MGRAERVGQGATEWMRQRTGLKADLMHNLVAREGGAARLGQRCGGAERGRAQRGSEGGQRRGQWPGLGSLRHAGGVGRFPVPFL